MAKQTNTKASEIMKLAREAAKAEREAARKAEAETRKLMRERAKAARAAEREAKRAAKRPIELRKLDEMAAELPKLSPAAAALLEQLTEQHDRDELSTLALHLQHFNRVKATELALQNKTLKVGDTVRICNVESKHNGELAEVTKVQRIRCYVKVAGVKNDVYLFTSDVTKVAAEEETEEPVTALAC